MRRLLAVGVVATCALLPAHAQGSVQTDRTAAALVMRQLDRLDARRAELADRRSAARARLEGLVTAIGVARVTIADEQAQITAARSALAAEVVGDYKAGTPNVATYVLGRGVVRRPGRPGRRARPDRLQRGGADPPDRGRDRRAGGDRGPPPPADRLPAGAGGRHRRGRAPDRRGHRRAAACAGDDHRADAGARRRRAGPPPPARRAGAAARAPGRTPTGRVFYGDSTWYGPGFAGDPTASGEIFDPHKLTCASPWLPFNTILRVTSTVTGKTVTVRVNDRGPFGHGVLDLSAARRPDHRPPGLAAGADRDRLAAHRSAPAQA